MSLNIKAINASFLIVGTSIGAAILGLPVEAAEGGFIPSLLSLLIVWIIMTISALVIVEVLSVFNKNTNYISVTERVLGRTFQFITFLVYLILFISLTLAYTKGGGVFLSDSLNQLPLILGSLMFLAVFAPLVLLGSKVLSFGNTPLTVLLFGSFFLIIILGVSKIKPSLIAQMNWKAGFFAFPMYITSFGFHSVLPSLSSYVGSKKALKNAVLAGTTITFSIYLVWQFFVLGVVPATGENGLMHALVCDQTAITPLKNFILSPVFRFSAQIFYFTSIATSFLGVGLGLIDFLLDAFKIHQKFTNRLFMCLLVYLPALWISQTSLNIFYISLKYGGGFACLYLFVVLPILFLIKNRSFRFKKHDYNGRNSK